MGAVVRLRGVTGSADTDNWGIAEPLRRLGAQPRVRPDGLFETTRVEAERRSTVSLPPLRVCVLPVRTYDSTNHYGSHNTGAGEGKRGCGAL